MANKGTESQLSVAQFITNWIAMSGRTQREIAEIVGYDKPNNITMLKQGTTKVPINRIPKLAEALGVDPVHMLRVVMKEYMPDAWEAISGILETTLISEDEAKILSIVRRAAGGRPVSPANELEELALESVVKEWATRYDAHTDASFRRIGKK